MVYIPRAVGTPLSEVHALYRVPFWFSLCGQLKCSIFYQQSKTCRTGRQFGRTFSSIFMGVHKLSRKQTFISRQDQDSSDVYEQDGSGGVRRRQDEVTSLTVMTRQRGRVSTYSARTVASSRWEEVASSPPTLDADPSSKQIVNGSTNCWSSKFSSLALSNFTPSLRVA